MSMTLAQPVRDEQHGLHLLAPGLHDREHALGEVGGALR
jgi:hypothetical protein